MIATLLNSISSRLLLRLSLGIAFAGFAICAAIAVASCDVSWIARGGAWISATGAFTLFAEWSRERELEHRRRMAEEVSQTIERYGAIQPHSSSSEAIALRDAIDAEIHAYRLPIVSASAALLFVGALVSGFGDVVTKPLLSLSGRCTIATKVQALR